MTTGRAHTHTHATTKARVHTLRAACSSCWRAWNVRIERGKVVAHVVERDAPLGRKRDPLPHSRFGLLSHVSVKARVVVQAALLHNHVPGVLVVRRALLVEVQRDRDLANAAIDAALGVARQLILRARVRELVARTLLFA